ncbi:DUF4139 domain-containing protein [Salidesulfovibrio onnuriiensis]|uniref:DUF4139 domain-containing protein n=1 Tax=Salidesulfovibrio onnuriiensis TaxID=2583823 RepID=UPI00164EF32D|nr:DUF4139 domain-containing protein [Salidesulfovibrio onnuriiensis]
MNYLKFIFFIALSLAISPALASAAGKSLTVTIYNNDRALINEVRPMELPKGQERVEFLGVPETVEPQSLRVTSKTSPKNFRVLDMNYEYDLVGTKTLLDRYVGKQLTVVLPDPSDATARMLKQATLIANNDRPVFQVGNEIYVGDYEAVLLPSLPQGLRAKPALVWLVDNNGPAKQDIEVSYLARGMGWRADYVLKVDRDNKDAGLSGWVTLTNNSGMAFEKAALKLVAGDVHEAPQPAPTYRGKALMMEAAMGDGMQQEEFFEYHLYSLDRPVDIANKQIKQVSLLQAPKIKVEKELVCEYHAGGNQKQKAKPPVNVLLKLRNDKQSGLGMPLPEGVVRAYQESSDGSVLLIGEDRIQHTPKGEEISLTMGKAFDVTVERIQTAYQKISKNSYKMSWKIEVRNGSDKPGTILLRDTLPGQWKVTRASRKYTKIGSAGIEFTVQAPPSHDGKGTVITYEAEITY